MCKSKNCVRLAVVWDVAPCNVVEIELCFGATSCFRYQAVNVYEITRRNVVASQRLIFTPDISQEMHR
jgi:hypothetical protein